MRSSLLWLSRRRALGRLATRLPVTRSMVARFVAGETLEEALEALGTVDAWPFLLSPQLAMNRDYRVSLRAGVRRGHLPDSLRVLLFWTDDWHRESEWFSWSLQR